MYEEGSRCNKDRPRLAPLCLANLIGEAKAGSNIRLCLAKVAEQARRETDRWRQNRIWFVRRDGGGGIGVGEDDHLPHTGYKQRILSIRVVLENLQIVPKTEVERQLRNRLVIVLNIHTVLAGEISHHVVAGGGIRGRTRITE